MTRHFNIGVEIEAVGRPYGTPRKTVDWYRHLAQRLINRGLPAVWDDCSRYSKHPEYHGGHWFVTRDGSLKRSPLAYVCMEVVSPKLNTKMPLSVILAEFWEAMRVHFSPQRHLSCGGHVHITPLNRRSRFSLPTLKTIALSTVIYEHFVASILSPPRRENKYCLANSRSVGSGLNRALPARGQQPSVAVLRRVAADVKACLDEKELCMYMQSSRYVLWNFQNIFPHNGRSTGTIEFRGGNQFLDTRGTLAWVAFVIGFVTLAMTENLIDAPKTYYLYVSPDDPSFLQRLNEWWTRIRRAAKQSKVSRHLPDDPSQMQTR
ncbi:swim zinc finger domain-containing protein [Ophiocordyceps camponoti-floridani]|uniref:Swim zinc finger domain-containing protein n=1 Tax=Ophiocordyceps camponoti-floridani TaxID=2030778 RepID=A0A8H4VGL3_9HYPO|nr:swim zinc finger domain-containing protein [Ophiocordyceps camponoti-floridani]